MSRDFPTDRDTLTLDSLRSAIADCFVALEIVGRRVTGDVPLDEASAIADFALDVAVVRGGSLPDWKRQDLSAIPVRAVRDGATVATGTGVMVLGHPLNALLWLAEALRREGRAFRRGDITMTGTCTGITKVAPAQVFSGHFGDLPPVRLYLA